MKLGIVILIIIAIIFIRLIFKKRPTEIEMNNQSLFNERMKKCSGGRYE